ncbi:imelysin family protein [Oryzifoliimicrobium ureilyticus]|uniref:imelysin family protein n=1 Tax=Oryzifoliimicrobium ureilyticus TaxID=3113724 RepID=UPI0030765141
MRLWCPLILSLALASPALAQEAPAPSAPQLNDQAVQSVMQRAVDEVIRPGYRNAQQSAARLTTAMKDLCNDASQPSLDKAKSAFDDTIRYWSMVEIVQTGPVIEDNLFEHILFYPDRKGLGLKQVQALIAKGDPQDATVDAISKKSVALQGLTALEYVLYGDGSNALTQQKNGFRCQYGAAVAGNVLREAGEVVAAWEKPDGVQASWKHPGPGNSEFMDGQEALTALLGILVHGAETLRDQRLEQFYKGKDSEPRPHLAIYWRSKNTWKSMAGNLQGLRTLWQKTAMGDLMPPDRKAVSANIDANFKALIDMVSKLNPDIDVATSEAERPKLDAVLQRSRDLITQISDDYGKAIGLSAGFSFSDGD